MIGVGRNGCGIIFVHPDSPLNRERACRKFGVSGQPQFAVFGRRLQVHSAGELVAECEIARVDRGGDDRSIERARALQPEVGTALHRQGVEMNLGNVRQVEIFSAQIQPETPRRGRIRGTAGNVGVFVTQMNIVKRGLAARDLQIGVEVLNRFPIGRGVRRVNVALHLGMRPGSGDLERDIRLPGNRVVKGRERRGRRDVNIVQIHARAKRGIIRELSFLQDCVHVKIGAGVRAPQRAPAKREIMRRELNAHCQGIPMHLCLGGARGGRRGEFKIGRGQYPAQRRR